ncbi:GntR family transcriptional regulator [Acetobacter sp. TBRC 12305]|nr:GntR family transcriptional regulator [Acetobacter garciniae]MBX0345590.1 GntR family transcriptional regulator [Acetobacter garciniae]
MPELVRLPTTQGERQSDKVFDILQKAITRCELPPGEIVSEPQLEQNYGFGRVPLRLAMDRLVQLGLVKPLHRRGYEVAPITLSDVRHTFELRLMVEPPTTRMATGKVDIAALRALGPEETELATPTDPATQERVIERNRNFHLLIAEAAGNPKVVTLLGHVLSDIDRVYYFGLLTDSRFLDMRDDHCKLIEALAANDGAKAEKISRKHIETGYAIVVDAIVNSSSLSRTTVQVMRS